MRRAWRGVKEQHMTQVDAAETFGVPRSTLQVYLKKELEDIPDDIRSGRFKPVFNAAQESQLVDDLLEFSRRYYAMSRKALVQSAFRLAEANHIPHPFKNGEAGYDWAYGFLKRNEGRLSIRTAQLTSIPRIFGFRKSTVYRFFDILESIIEKEQYGPHQIFNCDETGVTIVQSHAPKVIAQRGAKNVARIKAAERGSLVTLMGCASAGGAFVPPFFVFAGKKHHNQDAKVALGPLGSDSSNSKRGWMVSEIFIDWLHHFVHHVQPTAQKKVLLIMDNLKAHITLEAIDFAREHFIDLLTLPPHTSHRLQPLDVGFFSPLKSRLNEAIMKWQNENRYVKPNQFDIPAIIKAPFEDSAKPQTAMNAFSKTGIWVRASNGPNRHVINPDDFYPEDGNYDGNQSSSLGLSQSDSDHDDHGDSGATADNERIVDEEQEFYEHDNSAPEQSDSSDDLQFTLETVESEQFNIPGILTEDEDPTSISQNFLDSIIIFNSTTHIQQTPDAEASSASAGPTSFTPAIEQDDADASDASRRTSDGSINSVNVQDYPLLSIPEESPLPQTSNSTSTMLEVTLMDLEGPQIPVPVKTTSRHTESNLVTDQKYLDDRRQKESLKLKRNVKTSKGSPLKKKPLHGALRRSVIATRKQYATLAEAKKAPVRQQPSRAVKK